MIYREVTQYNLPTWVIGPQVGTEPFPERPADILKIWPSREPVRRLRPDEFNAEIGRLQKSHCWGCLTKRKKSYAKEIKTLKLPQKATAPGQLKRLVVILNLFYLYILLIQ
jgi:hypothetical protein